MSFTLLQTQNLLTSSPCFTFLKTTKQSHSFRGESQLYIFEDSEFVIKMMMIKGRSPTMRHVSRTHRAALDWLFDRINLDPKIQIKYVDTKNQFADILTKGNFTRDEWNHLLLLFNISIFRSASCPEARSKRMQQGTGEERIVAKSTPTLHLVSKTVASSPTAPVQIKYVDTKNQLADILTKGNLTREEWNCLLRLFHIMNTLHFASCHFSSTSSSQTMLRRLIQQERPGTEE